jgi:aminoglycoside 3-N-acetyltransferase
MIEAGLRELGIREGATVVAHSSLRSFGWVEGGADAVVDALCAAVAPSGTVCFPTLTFGDYGPRRPPPPFDPRATPGVVGRIPERFRVRPGVVRSLHPTHSLAAAGAGAEALLEGHERSPTPCGPASPWGRIARAGGQILLMGVGTSVCTMFHGAEEEAEPEARCTAPTPCRIVTGTGEQTVWLRLHKPYRGAVSNRAGLECVLDRAGVVRRTYVGSSRLLAIDARGLWDLSLELLRARPSRRTDYASALARKYARRALHAVRRR